MNLFVAALASMACLAVARRQRARWNDAAGSSPASPVDRRSLSPCLTGVLSAAAVSYEHLVAGVLDLAARGRLTVELARVDDDPAARAWWQLTDTTEGQLWAHESVLLTELDANPGPAEFPSITNRSSAVLTRAIWDDLYRAGCITRSPTRARTAQLRLAGAAALIGTLFLLFHTHIPVGVGVGLGMLIGSVILIRLAPRQPRRTALGQHHQRIASTLATEVFTPPLDPGADLATAVALGVGDPYMAAALGTSAPVPSWLGSATEPLTWDLVRALVEQPACGWPLYSSHAGGS